MTAYTSLSVLLFLALALALPSGFSLGAAMLTTGAMILLRRDQRSAPLDRSDKVMIAVMCIYFTINIVLNLIHHAPAAEYDAPSRFLLVVPAMLLLHAFPPRPQALWAGAVIGALGAAQLGFSQLQASDMARVGGSTNPIQFGNISLWLATLSICGLAWAGRQRHAIAWQILLACGVLGGLLASLSSGSRGSWIALPCCLLFGVWLTWRQGQRWRAIKGALASVAVLSTLWFFPESGIQARAQLAVQEAGNYVLRTDAESSVGARLQMWRIGLDMAPAHLLVGWGKQGLIDYKEQLVRQGLASPFVAGHTHLHNEYLDALVKRGIPGLLAVLLLYLAPFLLFLQRFRRTACGDVRVYAVAGMMLTISYSVFGLTQAFLTHNNGVMIFAFSIAVLWSLAQQEVVPGPADGGVTPTVNRLA